MLILKYTLAAIGYLACPIAAKIILFIANVFIPDPLPFIDEIFMLMTLFVKGVD